MGRGPGPFRLQIVARLRSDSGQSLIIIVVAMFVVMMIAAVAIDLSSWYQKHHQQQVAADAGALAAANCLANQSSDNAGGNTCTSATDTTDAGGVATSIANTNQAKTATASYSSTTSGSVSAVKDVTVTTSAPDSSFFSRILGLSSTATAVAVASVRPNSKGCGTTGVGCLMFYAASNSCSSAAITFQTGNSTALNGGILANGPIDDSKGNGGNFNGYISYGAGATCNTNTSLKGNATFAHNPTQQVIDYGSSSTPNWPIDYATYFPACSGTGSSPTNCSTTTGSPNYCTFVSASISQSAAWTTSSNGVYCAVGTGAGVNPKDPSTWNGVVAGGTSGSVTMIGGTVRYQGGSLAAYSNNLLAYATSTAACSATYPAFDATGGNTVWTGDVFAPNGCAAVSGGNVTFTGFIESQTISYTGGASSGDGPTYGGGSGNFLGSDSLTG